MDRDEEDVVSDGESTNNSFFTSKKEIFPAKKGVENKSVLTVGNNKSTNLSSQTSQNEQVKNTLLESYKSPQVQ